MTSETPATAATMRPMYKGEPEEWIDVECADCGSGMQCTRDYLINRREVEETSWTAVESEEDGTIVAYCPRCSR